jgi:hypothetical protein
MFSLSESGLEQQVADRMKPARVQGQRYALHVGRLSKFFERLPGGHRPPTGPLTTAEASEAEDLKNAPVEDNPPAATNPEAPPAE